MTVDSGYVGYIGSILQYAYSVDPVSWIVSSSGSGCRFQFEFVTIYPTTRP
jgi:hypothetical protein